MIRKKTIVHNKLVELLSEFGDPAVAKQQAINIEAAMLSLIDGYRIVKGQDGFNAEAQPPRSGSVGKALSRLRTAARRTRQGKMSRADWAHLWAGQPRTVKSACRRHLLREGSRSLDPGKLLGSIYADGVTIVVPTPEAILIAVDAYLQTDSTERQRYKHDPGARIVMSAIRTAYTALTGKSAIGRGRGVSGEPSKVIQFSRRVEALFGTHVFPNADSTRLRKNFGDR